jgi:hypothetical protein
MKVTNIDDLIRLIVRINIARFKGPKIGRKMFQSRSEAMHIIVIEVDES